MTLPLRADTRPVLSKLAQANNPMAAWTYRVSPEWTGQDIWRCVYVQQLDQFDGGNNHSVYIDVIDSDGKRIGKPDIKVEFGYGTETKTTIFEKPEWEPGANFVYGADTNAWCKIAGFPSDTVLNLYSGFGHTSYYVVFQLQKAGQVAPPVVTPPHQPGTVIVPVDLLIDAESKARDALNAVLRLRR